MAMPPAIVCFRLLSGIVWVFLQGGSRERLWAVV